MGRPPLLTFRAMPELRKVTDSPTEIRYAHPHAGGWVALAVGLVGGVLAWRGLEGGTRWALVVFAGLIALAGLSGALTRIELIFDLSRRRLRYRRGNVFNSDVEELPFDAVQKVVLKKELERRAGKEVVDEWEVEVEVEGWPRPVEVFESKREDEARTEAEALARRIGVPLGERTGR